MLRRNSSVDYPTPLLKTRRFLIPHLMHPKSPMVDEWLKGVPDSFPDKLVPSSPPNFYRGFDSDSSSETSTIKNIASNASENPLKDGPLANVMTPLNILGLIPRPSCFGSSISPLEKTTDTEANHRNEPSASASLSAVLAKAGPRRSTYKSIFVTCVRGFHQTLAVGSVAVFTCSQLHAAPPSIFWRICEGLKFAFGSRT